ncbi:Hermansky-Pudlak syndrome 3 protein isoform X2 [Cryptotermes secundus]|nr:Hermansky-Pudlak syndrome 3 protein isoform X2 [Cryptotermes secundus]
MVQQPMRARIAGRVTPSSTQSGPASLEMIELPLKMTPNVIACCQTTGNLLVASHKTLTLYHFRVCTRDVSRLQFIDFEDSGVYVELSFSPSSLSLAEDIIACMAEESVHVFRLGPGTETEDGRQGSQDHRNHDTNSNSHVDWDGILRGELDARSKLHQNSFPLRVDLPSIVAEKAASCPSSPSGVVHRQSPFQAAALNMTAMVHCASPSATPWAARSEVLHLLQLQMSVPQASSGTTRQMCSGSDEFRCLILKPLYMKTEETQPCDRKGDAVHSKHYGDMVSIICLVVTQQEGYLYQFMMQNLQEPSAAQQAACVTVYPFTAPVIAVVVERFVLHALTETGLETYTLRTGHRFVAALGPANNLTSACPPVDDPVCLVGLRPFLGVEHLLMTDFHLVLLACSEGSSSSSQDSHCGGGWTLYSLTVPSPAALYSDMLSVGSAHRWSSPATYRHLLCEGHVILRMALNTATWQPGSSEALTSSDEKLTSEIKDLYRDSCALLADYYIMSDEEADWELTAPYYTMAGLAPVEVVNRVKEMAVPPDVAARGKHRGLMSYLNTSLLQQNHAPGNVAFGPAVHSFAHTLLDLFEEHDPGQVSTLVLHSALLRECATDRVLAIMKKQLSTRAVPAASDALALVLLCIQRGSPEQAVAVLNSLSHSSLTNLLSDNPTLLLEQQYPPVTEASPADIHAVYSPMCSTSNSRAVSSRRENVPSFSELASVLMDSKPAVLADVLAGLVTVSQFATLQQILQVFLEYIPSRIGIAGSAASHVLQQFMEMYFVWYFSDVTVSSYDITTVEALKILVRSYLSHLRQQNPNAQQNKKHQTVKADEPRRKVLFEEKRLAFLGKMPPYSADLSKRLISLQEGMRSTPENTEPAKHSENTNSDSLFKLQCLLCSGKLPPECLSEVRQFVHTHPQLHGNLSLQVLCVPPREGTNILLDFCPHALLHYAQDRFTSETEWKSLVLLLHRKTQTLGDETVLKPLYQQVTRDILTYLAQTLSLEEMCRVLPPGWDKLYHGYVQICQQVGHANHIRALIMATGQQLLGTLNL